MVIETLKQLVVEQDDSSSSAEIKSEEECEVVAVGDGKTSEEYIQLEKDIHRMLQNPKIKSEPSSSSSSSESSESVASLLSSQRIPPVKKIGSRTSSFDSSCNPGSPFHNNPLLVSHDYAKSPLMEIAEDSNSSLKDDGGASSRKESTSSSGTSSDPKEDSGPAAPAPNPSESHPTANQETNSQNNPTEPESGSGTASNASLAQSVADFDPKTSELSEPHRFAPKDLLSLLRSIESEIHSCEIVVKDENDKRKRHKIDDCRRVHNYDEFITTFLTMLTEQGMLGDLLDYGLNPKKKPATSGSDSRGNGAKKSNSSLNSRVSSSSSARRSKSKPGRPKKRK